MKRVVIVLAALFALAGPPPALADAPLNDNRASAEQVPAFPATLSGTTVGATLERLDPQTGACGSSESTVWYRIDQAPDGLIRLAVQGAGFTPALRVYRVGRSNISEVRCANAKAGAAATVSFQSVRGASFLVMVGKRPGTTDAAFQLDASVFLPPANDHRGGAVRIKKLVGTVSGSTVGATSDDSDPGSCGLAGESVWYSFTSRAQSRVAIKVQAGAGLDTSLVVLEQVRSKTTEVGCVQTGRTGRAVATFDVERGARYFVVVGQQQGSPSGTFSFQVIAAQKRETVATHALPARGVSDSVHGLADVNDLFTVEFQAGVTYRIAFRAAEPCPALSLYGRSGLPAQGFEDVQCSGYRTFTPGPDGGGTYVLGVDASPDAVVQPYRLQVAAAGVDDIGVGIALENRGRRFGALLPRGVDVVDLYHFDVPILSDVKVTLAAMGGTSFSLLLLRDTGERVGTGQADLKKRLGPGRYVVAVQAPPGTNGGTYTLALLIRDLTATTLTVNGKADVTVAPGTAVVLQATTTPAASGVDVLQIDRFDPLTGWHFFRSIHVPASSATVSWTPPTAGRWRVRASYRGSLTSSPSRTGYVLIVAGPPPPPAP